MTKHAKLSASGAHRWMACPGSVAAESGAEDQQSPFAAEGSAAHYLGETCLRTESHAEEYLGCLIAVTPQGELFVSPLDEGYDLVFEVDKAMADYVQQYVDLVRSYGGELFVEQRVDFSRWVPEGFGTSDAIIVDGNDLMVIDLKYGKGVKVDAKDNPQARLYALGAYEDYGFIFDEIDTVTSVICQPRLDHVSVETISVGDLLAWADLEVRPAASAACSADAPRHPGEKQCQFCKAKATCRELAEHCTAVTMAGFEDVDAAKKVGALTPAEIGEYLSAFPLVESWISAVKAHAHDELSRGVEVPNWKLVAGRSSRIWADPTAAEGALKRKLGAKAAYKPREIISPAQAEKVLGKGDRLLIRYVEKREGKPTIAPVTDKRPAINHLADFQTEGE